MGGGGKRVASGSLISAAALLVCIPSGWEGERTGHMFYTLPPFNFPGMGGGGAGCRPLSVLCSGALCTDTSGVGGRARGPFLFAVPPLFFPEWARGERMLPAALYSQQRCFWYACQRGERASARAFFLRFYLHKRKAPEKKQLAWSSTTQILSIRIVPGKVQSNGYGNATLKKIIRRPSLTANPYGTMLLSIHILLHSK